ncbi:hypothetical protein [Rhodococcus sp. SGAir0479]|uniref:hypothetical protein n=1 Tax=Rhodococcus sp. SGAir0479 TaxID=2567884 RepID=UPI0020C8139F|nr:hypothetical protein [Rhodococcus sp. SGAir0479]
MGLGEYSGEYTGEMVAPPTWLVVLAAIPILLTLLLLVGFAWKEWRDHRRMRSSPVHAAAWAMDPDELDRAIRALGARERALLDAGDVDAADAVAADMLICVAVSERRDGAG